MSAPAAGERGRPRTTSAALRTGAFVVGGLKRVLPLGSAVYWEVGSRH
jgi:hypothetical protein